MDLFEPRKHFVLFLASRVNYAPVGLVLLVKVDAKWKNHQQIVVSLIGSFLRYVYCINLPHPVPNVLLAYTTSVLTKAMHYPSDSFYPPHMCKKAS